MDSRKTIETIQDSDSVNDVSDDLTEEEENKYGNPVSVIDMLGDDFSYSKICEIRTEDDAKEDNETIIYASFREARVGAEYQAIIPTITQTYTMPRWTTKENEETTKPTLKSKANKRKLSGKMIDELFSKVSLKLHPSATKYSKVYNEGVWKYGEEENVRVWSRKEKWLFFSYMFVYPKRFSIISRELSYALKTHIDTKECIDYYYRDFKYTSEYRQVKLYVKTVLLNPDPDVHAFRIRLPQPKTFKPMAGIKENDILPIFSEPGMGRLKVVKKKTAKAKSSTGKKNKKKRKVTTNTVDLPVLIKAGWVTPGPQVLSVKYHGQEVKGSLTNAGKIEYDGAIFESISAWSYAMKKGINPLIKSDNGWSSVQYKNSFLSKIRSQYQLAKKEEGVKHEIS
eukprot:augustus_masked-scaffold_7-processed-gene-15.59-mRNA-1 protein AED:0.04 eAED:0.04 QI:0/-1/0/1/-1/1/1/0/396